MKFQAIKGVRDILPPESALWNRVEQTAREVFATYGYGEIRLPIFEQTELFARSIGADTDVVSKEMYTFFVPFDYQELISLAQQAQREGLGDPNAKGFTNLAEFSRIVESFARLEPGELHTLRPEATASVCRAYIEHGMQTLPGNVKLYYIGPMFRRERPQKGRYRQFYQIGAEVLGQSDAPSIDAEVIEMLMHFFAKTGLGERSAEQAPPKEGGSKLPHSTVAAKGAATGCTLYINSIGCKECRPKYVAELKAALEKVREKLGADSQRRIETNPLRVLDSKLPEEQALIETLPRISEHLCEACSAHYAEVKKQLDLRGVAYQENWRLVRGLDYYMRTTFEITAPGLGSQNAVCGGGRYDGLVELLGGPATKGIGFAIGTDRLILSLQEAAKAGGHAGPPLQNQKTDETPQQAAAKARREQAPALHVLDVFIAWMGAAAQPAAVKIARTLREAGISVEVPAEEMKFKKSIGLADKLGARFALIIGENEIAEGKYALKRMSDGVQEKVTGNELVATIKKSG